MRTYGTLPRNAFRGPGLVNLNLAFAKSTPLSDKAQLEVRADFFNLLNHTEFLNPDTNPDSPTFGRLLNTFSRGQCSQCHSDKGNNHFPGRTCWQSGCHEAIHGSNHDRTLFRR